MIEDETNTRMAMQWLLEQNAATVTTVESAANAIKAFEAADSPKARAD